MNFWAFIKTIPAMVKLVEKFFDYVEEMRNKYYDIQIKNDEAEIIKRDEQRQQVVAEIAQIKANTILTDKEKDEIYRSQVRRLWSIRSGVN